ncbi:MAG: hypothetical protein WA705_11960 [Candidatus Ozemobacteraceae bacterium]
MIVQMTAGTHRLRIFLFLETGKEVFLNFPMGMLEESGAAERAANDLIGIVGKAWAIFHAGTGTGFPRLLELLEKDMPGRLHELSLFPSKVEWACELPTRMPVERVLALQGAAELWPLSEVVLVNLDGPPIFDILQNGGHLAGFEPFGFGELLEDYFPHSPTLLRYDPTEMKSFVGKTSSHLACQLLIEGLVSAWRAHISSVYLKKGPPLFVSYGDDDAGLRLFPNLSDTHHPDLLAIAARRLASQQWVAQNR